MVKNRNLVPMQLYNVKKSQVPVLNIHDCLPKNSNQIRFGDFGATQAFTFKDFLENHKNQNF
jgi:hypothetical protein